MTEHVRIPPPNVWLDDPPREEDLHMIPGLLQSNGNLLISGEYDVGKSLVALEICHALLTGSLLWGKIAPTRQIKRATYILGEHDEEQIKEQWRLTGLNIPPKSVRLIGIEHRRLLIARNGMLMRGNLDLYRDWCKDSKLIIFDPISAFIGGGADAENDSIQMRALINAMGDIARAHGATLILIHHMGKPAFDPKEGMFKHRDKYASRGSSGIEDAVMCCFYMEKTEKQFFRLKRAKFKGQAPSFYLLHRDDLTLRHDLVKKGLTPREYVANRLANLPPPPTKTP